MAFDPIHTERLVIRHPAMTDLDALVARRSEPDVARFQSWSAPYPRNKAEELLSSAVAMSGPEVGQWSMVTVASADTGEVLGDLAIHLTEQGKVAEIGYTFAVRYWGNGFATEAVEGLVDRLFKSGGVERVSATLDADNLASARLLERTGFLYEGRTRLSYWPADQHEPAALDRTVDRAGEQPGDDLLYGLTKADRSSWLNRRTGPPDDVQLIEITSDNYRSVMALATHNSQEMFVAPVAASFADALFPYTGNGVTVQAVLRAIEADGELAGFMMFARRTPRHAEPYLWRMLIDRTHQRRGIGGRAIDALIEQLRTEGHAGLFVSWVEGPGSPAPFYLGRGFEPTGVEHDGETEARKELS